MGKHPLTECIKTRLNDTNYVALITYLMFQEKNFQKFDMLLKICDLENIKGFSWGIF